MLPPPLVRYRRAALACLLASTVVAALYGWIQVATGADFRHAEPLWRVPVKDPEGSIRARGFFTHPLTYAGVLAMVGTFATLAGLCARAESRRTRVWLVGIGAFLLVALMSTHSKGYYLAVALVLVLALPALPWRLLVPSVAALAIAMAVAVSLPAVHQRFAGLARVQMLPPQGVTAQDEHPLARPGVLYWSTEIDRLARWYYGAQIAAAHPVFGVGRPWEIYQVELRERSQEWRARSGHSFGETPREIGNLHNGYLQIAVEMGAVGLLAYVALFVFIGRRLVGDAMRAWARRPGAEGPPIAALGVLVLFAIVGLFEHNFSDSEVQSTMWFLIGLTLVASAVPPSSPPRPSDSEGTLREPASPEVDVRTHPDSLEPEATS